MDPTLSGVALGLLLGAAKVGLIGTVAFGIAWWRARRRLRALELTQPDPALLDERLANLERANDFIGARVAELADAQTLLARQLGATPDRGALGRPGRSSATDSDASMT